MEKLKSRLQDSVIGANPEIIREIVSQTLHFIIGFLFGGISFAGGISPFATGFTGAVSNRYMFASAIGSAIGYSVFFGLSGGLRLIGGVCFITLVRSGFSFRSDKTRSMIFSVVLTFSCTFISSLAVFIAVGGEPSFLIACFCESLIAAAFSSFTMKVSVIRTLKKKGAFFAPTDTAAVAFFGSILLLSLDRFRIYGFSVAVCLACLLIMLFALCGRESASAVTGICSAITLGFNETQPHLMLNFILAGLMTGLSGIYGKIPIALSLVFSTVISIILRGEPDTVIMSLAEVVSAGVIFVLIPEKWLLTVSKAVTPLSRDTYDEEKGRTLSFMLRRSAKAVRDITESVNAVSEFLRKTDKPSTDIIAHNVKEDICRECNKYDFCWNKCNELTEKAFRNTNEVLCKNGRLITEDLPDRLSLICRMPDKITESFNFQLCNYEAGLAAKNEVVQAKKSAAMQFSCLSALLDEAAENVLDIPESDPALAAALSPVFSDMGFSLLGINAVRDSSKKSILQVYCTKVPVIPHMSVLLEKIYEVTGVYYNEPVADEYSGEGTVLSFSEERRFAVEYHTASHTGEGEVFSGDTSECFYDGRGFFYSVLSDGMGTGTRAAIDSVMTCSLVSRLMRAGFSVRRALDTVNCALLVRTSDESLSTIDIFSLNLDTGEGFFYKAGAAASFIYKDSKTLAVEKSSLPLGILRETGIEKSSINLSEGDTVVIISDGASVIPNAQFKEIFNKNGKLPVKELSELIMEKAFEFSVSGKHDDITVTCIRIILQD